MTSSVVNFKSLSNILWHIPTNETIFKPAQTQLNSNNVSVTTWIVSPANQSAIHRFFDTSPISPNNRYVVFTTFPVDSAHDEVNSFADIVVFDMTAGETHIVDKTFAWDTQVGAHTQWGRTDDELYYNSFSTHHTMSNSTGGDTISQNSVRGVSYSMSDRSKRVLDCPVYHISSDGKYSASPNLLKIGHTQRGYGVHSPGHVVPTNTNASKNDGLYIMNLRSGICKLVVSLHQLAVAGSLDTTSTPMYGFHTKWSPDNQLVMFVVRSLERTAITVSAAAEGMLGSLKTSIKQQWSGNKRVRVQHLFVTDRRGKHVVHVVSWASKPFRNTATGQTVILKDGNHPNWVPGTHKISMNLQADPSPTVKVGAEKQIRWQIVVFDVSQHFFESTHSVSNDTITSTAPALQTTLSAQSVYAVGTGHPTFHSSGRYVLTDAYAKERGVLGELHPLTPLSVPLRLIDLATQQEVWLLQMQIERTKDYFAESRWWRPLSWWTSAAVGSSGREWRCDMHPSWSRDFQWVALNGRPSGGNRSVVLVHLGPDLSKYFTS